MPSSFLRRAVAFTATTAAVCALALTSAAAAFAAIVPSPISNSAPGAAIALTPVGSYDTNVYKESAAEIVQAYRDRLFVVNAQAGTVSVEVLEGDWTPDRVVVLKFPSIDAARRFNDSPEYGRARAAREGAAVMRMVVVEGV